MLWSGVIEEHHQQTTDARDQGGNEEEGELAYMDLGYQKYVACDHLMDAVEGFCLDAESQGRLDENSGSITRKDSKGTQEEVTIAIGFESRSDFKPQKDNCVKALMKAVDRCPVPGNRKSPNNVKARGNNTASPVKYHIEPAKNSQPIAKTFRGWSNFHYNSL